MVIIVCKNIWILTRRDSLCDVRQLHNAPLPLATLSSGKGDLRYKIHLVVVTARGLCFPFWILSLAILFLKPVCEDMQMYLAKRFSFLSLGHDNWLRVVMILHMQEQFIIILLPKQQKKTQNKTKTKNNSWTPPSVTWLTHHTTWW